MFKIIHSLERKIKRRRGLFSSTAMKRRVCDIAPAHKKDIFFLISVHDLFLNFLRAISVDVLNVYIRIHADASVGSPLISHCLPTSVGRICFWGTLACDETMGKQALSLLDTHRLKTHLFS